jgi:hypothetical protein
MRLLDWTRHMFLAIDAWAHRWQRGPSMRELNTRIERAQGEVAKSAQHAAYAEQEIQQTKRIRQENQIAATIRHSLGIGYGDRHK